MSDHGQKSILITGGSRGIGRAAVLRLAVQHRVAFTGRNRTELEETTRLAKAAGHEVTALVADVEAEEDVRRSVAEARAALGRIDVLINNAGMGIFKRVDEFTMAEVERTFRVNIFGPFLYTRYVVPEMIERRAGQIINVASVAGLNGFQSGSAYAASKFALVGFTESIREDLKRFGIAVTAVCPGGVRTDFGGKEIASRMQAGDYLLEPDDVARTLEYLVSESETSNAKLIELKPRRREESRG